MHPKYLILPVSLLALAACGAAADGNAQANDTANAAAPAAAPAANGADANGAGADANGAAAAPERVLRTETVSGTFTGWEMGDYLWAQVAVPGREAISAVVLDAEPAGLFLNANVGRAVTVEVETVMMHVPEAGGMQEMRRIRAARNDAGTAEAWWQTLSAADRTAAQRRFEEGPLSAGGR